MDVPAHAFSFVDRILSVELGVRVRGRYEIPANLDEFSSALVGEAIGQLAAWSAMASLDFRRKPLAGLVERIEIHSDVRSGQVLELAAEIQSVDEDAVAYSGTAHADGSLAVELHNSVGPMVEMDEFDDASSVSARFEGLCAGTAAPTTFAGLSPLESNIIGGEPGQSVRATLQIPERADFFFDHFPRRSLFPGSLLMRSKLALAVGLATDALPLEAGASWMPVEINDIKIRTFMSPGDELELEAAVVEHSDGSANLTIASRRGKRAVGAARVTLRAQGAPGPG